MSVKKCLATLCCLLLFAASVRGADRPLFEDDQPPAGAAASMYRDPQGRFQISVPPGWTADMAGDGARISRGSAYANVLVAGGASSPSALVQQIAQQVGTQWKNFQMVQNGQWNLGGLPAEFRVYTGTNPKGLPALLRIVATSGFVLLMSVPQNDWEALKADLRQIEAGFSTGRPPGGAAPAGRASLGVSCREVNSGEMWGSGGATVQGAIVEEIGPGSPAQKAGFRIGDTIISMNGQAVKGVKDLARLVAAHRPGDTVEIVVLRGGKPLEFMVTLAGRP
jgi:membrane-associated protease RseP (regulator of RpoE activity)